MSWTAAAIAAFLAQAAPVTASAELADVGYTELRAGETDAALRKLEANARDSSDPALLINLGTAYARQGATARALAAFRAAAASPERYELELADGSWADSRVVAQQALARLQRATAQAAR